MAKVTGVIEHKFISSGVQTHLRSSPRFDWVIILMGFWMVGGVHLDAWAHHRFEFETFFTPWHGVIYSGFMALAAVLVGPYINNLRRGYNWRYVMPDGYGLSLAGAAIFMTGGLGDMLWHTLFGIEIGIEALLSPTHLLLAYGSALIVTGPLRAVWRRPADISQSWLSFTPAILSLALLLAELSFFTAYAHPLSETFVAIGRLPPSGTPVFYFQGLGISAVLLQSAIMMGVILWWLKPSLEQPAAFRWFALGAPAIFYALYFLTLALNGGIWWSFPLWSGAILLAGITGWLLRYAFLPPQTADEWGA